MLFRSGDRVEQLGIERSRSALAAADVVLLLFDLAEGWSSADAELRALVPAGVPLLLVGNKADLLDPRPADSPAATAALSEPSRSAAADLLGSAPGAPVHISALQGLGREQLAAALLRLCGASDLEGLQVALNARQRELASQAATALAASQRAAAEQIGRAHV